MKYFLIFLIVLSGCSFRTYPKTTPKWEALNLWEMKFGHVEKPHVKLFDGR
jgi:hypothetical protein